MVVYSFTNFLSSLFEEKLTGFDLSIIFDFMYLLFLFAKKRY